MKRFNSIQVKLKPNKVQLKQIEECGENCRKLWNYALSIQLDLLKENKPIMNYYSLTSNLKNWKLDKRCSFLDSLSSQMQQQTLRKLSKALFRYLTKGKKNNFGLPKFKSYFDHRRSFVIPQNIRILNGKKLFIPLIGYVKFLINKRTIPETIKQVVVTRKAKGWYAYLIAIQDIPETINISNSITGIDMGISNFLTTSSGEFFHLPEDSLNKWQNKLKAIQQKLSLRDHTQKNKTGTRRNKMKDRLRRIHYKITCIRNNFHHHLSKQIANDNDIIFAEDLKIANMTKSAKGTIENPGKNVKAKSGLNRSILKQGWSSFLFKLQYKLLDKKRLLVLVHPNNTSRQCIRCGYTDKSNRISQSLFVCQSCGYSDHADVHAAQNIRCRGLDLANNSLTYFNSILFSQFKELKYSF